MFVFMIFDIFDLENVKINTKIDFVSCLQPKIWKVMQKNVWPRFSRSNIKVRWLILGFSEILDLENVRIDTKFKSASCIQPELMKVIQWMCVTLNSKVNRRGHGIVFNIFDILDLENVRIDTKINFVSCLQPEIWKIMQKGIWPWFSRSCNKDRIFSLSPLDSLTPKTYPLEIFLKNSDGKTKIQGGGTHPPWASEVGFLPWASAG